MRVAGLGILLGLALCATASAHEPDADRWAPWTGGPRFALPATEVLRALPIKSTGELDLDHNEAFDLVPQEIARLAGGPTQGRTSTHRAGGRLTGTGSARITRADTGFQASEPTLGVMKDGTLFFVGTEGGQHAVLRSRDDGATWTRLDPGASGQQAEENTFDPYIWVDPGTDRLWDADLTAPNCAGISASDDGGDTFTFSTNCNHTDHQTLFAGPPPKGGTEPTGHPHVVYYCSNDGGATVESLGTGCSRSLDGGTTWIRTGALAFQNDPSRTGGSFGIPGFCSGATGHGHVGPDGTVYVPRGWCDQPYLAFSKDEGLTWTRTKVADLGVIVGIEDEVIGTTAGFAIEDHEASVATDAAGNLFYMWIAGDHLPYVAVSRDGGASFAKPLMVAAPGVNEAWGPSIAAGDKGRIAFAYIGTTNSPGGPYCSKTTSVTTCETADGRPATPASAYEGTKWNGYMGMSVDALAGKPEFQSAAVSTQEDPLVAGAGCGPVRCLAELDFIDVVIARDGSAWAAFVDGCDADACTGSGVGILGHMTGGPPLEGTVAEQRPPVVAPASASAPCTTPRKITLRVKAPKRGRLRAVRATVNGKRLKSAKRGRGAIVRVDLRRYRGRTARITIVTRTSAGRRFTTRRTYRVCA
jgi:hypothetical protein